MKHLIWAAVTVGAFLAGLYLGHERADTSPGGAADGAHPARAESPPRAPWHAAGGEVVDRLGPAMGAGKGIDRAPPGDPTWTVALDRLDALTRRGEPTAAERLRKRLLDQLLARARAGAPVAAAARLAEYLERNPHDPDGYLLDADLRQMQGRAMDALSPLLDLLQFEDDPAVVRRARDRLRLLVDAQEAQLANTGDTAALVRLFEDLARRDPGFDGHRLRLAHWLLQAGRVDDAEQTLAETGTQGVDPRAREDLAARIRLARTSLPLERRGDALHVSTRMSGVSLDMLVDTGATTTAISRDRAAALNAAPTGVRVQVRTAGGLVESEVHRVSDVTVGGVHLGSLDVLVLDGPLPPGVDGLLGMDVLGRFPGAPGTR